MASAALAIEPKKTVRVVELDILRGFLLVWMTLTHLPTWASNVSNQTFGFVSGAEGFIFLAAFMIGQIQLRAQQKRGVWGAIRDIAKRTSRVYLYHCGLLAIAFSLAARIGTHFHREPLENLLSYYLQSPHKAIMAAALLEYKPSLLDILPMYVVFMALTPTARYLAQRWGWEPVLFCSFAIWAAAQFGLRAWAYRHINLFGLDVPENSTGAFDMFGWQLLWMVGLALGTIYAEDLASKNGPESLPTWLLNLSASVALVLLILRYCPTDQWMDKNLYGWLIDKWHLGAVRILNFAALSILLVRYGSRIAKFRSLQPLARLGQASIEVFSVQVLCCLGAVALSRQADPSFPWWEQVMILVATFSALFATARAHEVWVGRTNAPHDVVRFLRS